MKEKTTSLKGNVEGVMAKKNAIHWFRKGLRLHDNPALIDALKDSASYRCVYILDPWFAGASQVGINKWR
jgi:cryptochrome